MLSSVIEILCLTVQICLKKKRRNTSKRRRTNRSRNWKKNKSNLDRYCNTDIMTGWYTNSWSCSLHALIRLRYSDKLYLYCFFMCVDTYSQEHAFNLSLAMSLWRFFFRCMYEWQFKLNMFIFLKTEIWGPRVVWPEVFASTKTGTYSRGASKRIVWGHCHGNGICQLLLWTAHAKGRLSNLHRFDLSLCSLLYI